MTTYTPRRDREEHPQVYLSNYENTPAEREAAARLVARLGSDDVEGAVRVLDVLGLSS